MVGYFSLNPNPKFFLFFYNGLNKSDIFDSHIKYIKSDNGLEFITLKMVFSTTLPLNTLLHKVLFK